MESNITKIDYYFFIDFLRSFACCFVVFHHCLIYFPKSSFGMFYMANLKYFFPTVPTYLLISGFVHSKNIEHKYKAYSTYLLEHTKRILVPYFFISLSTLLFRYMAEKSHIIPLEGLTLSWKGAILRLIFSGIEGHYYFLEMLFLYLLILPFIVKKLKTLSTTVILFLLILLADIFFAKTYMGLRNVTWSPLDLLVSTLAGFKFFIFGLLLYRSFNFIKPLILRYGAISCYSLILLYFLLHLLLPGGKEYWFLLLDFAYFSLALIFFDKAIFFIKQISLLSFGIYIIHQPYFIKLSRVMLSPLHAFPNIMLLLTCTFTLLLTIITVKTMMTNRFCSLVILGKKK